MLEEVWKYLLTSFLFWDFTWRVRSETEICFRQVRSSKKFSKNALIIMTCPHPRASGSKKVLPAHTNAFPPKTRQRYFFSFLLFFLKKNRNSNLPPTTGVLSFDRVTQKKSFCLLNSHIYSRKPAAPAFEWGKNRSVFEKKKFFSSVTYAKPQWASVCASCIDASWCLLKEERKRAEFNAQWYRVAILRKASNKNMQTFAYKTEIIFFYRKHLVSHLPVAKGKTPVCVPSSTLLAKRRKGLKGGENWGGLAKQKVIQKKLFYLPFLWEREGCWGKKRRKKSWDWPHQGNRVPPTFSEKKRDSNYSFSIFK